MDVVQTLDGGRRNAYDPDEIEEEQRERERRNKINAEFNMFVKRVQVGWGPQRGCGARASSCPAGLAHSRILNWLPEVP